MKLPNLWLLLFVMILISCKPQIKEEQIARELCDCMRPIVAVYQETERLTEDDQVGDIQQMMEKMEAAAAESDACADRLNEQYGELDDQQAAVEAAMRRLCPELTAVMDEMENMQD